MAKNEDIFNNNFCFSKVLKDIDFRIKFRNYREEKSLYILKQLKREQKEKRILFEKRKIHNEIVHSLQKANEENEMILNYRAKKLNKNNLSQNNLYSTKNTFYFPKISKKEEKINIDNKLINFEKLWKEQQYLNKNKRNLRKRNNSNKTMYNSINDIFDQNYDKIKKRKEKKTEKRIILDRIKYNNLKVKKKCQIHQDIMKKFKDKREYSPNFNAIEKHLPEVNLKTKSQRIFPIKFIKIYNIGEFNSLEKRNESIPKKILFKNNLYQSIYLNNLSSCTIIKNYQNNESSFFEKKNFRDSFKK